LPFLLAVLFACHREPRGLFFSIIDLARGLPPYGIVIIAHVAPGWR